MVLHLAVLQRPDRGALPVSSSCLLLRPAVLQLLDVLRCAVCMPRLPAADCMACHTPAQNKPCSSCCWQLDIHLSHAVLCRCKNVHDEGFAGLATLTGLTALDVSECATLSDVGLGALVDKLVGLQELNLHGCIHVTDAGECSRQEGGLNLCRAPVKGGSVQNANL